MKNYVINNGSFTKAGNFSGYTALGQRVHIYQRQMEALGFSTNEEVKDSLPFYCIADLREIQPVDDKGNPTGEVSERLTALSVFKTRDEIKNAHADAAFLDIEIKQSISEQATKVGLSQSAIDSLLAVSI